MRKGAAFIFILALAARLIYLADYSRTPAFPIYPNSDGGAYAAWAEDIAAGDILGPPGAYLKWPLYAYFLAALTAVLGPSAPKAAILIQMVLGALHITLIYLIARRLFSPSAALAAGVLGAAYAPFIFYDGLLIYTGPALFLNAAFIYALLAGRGRESPLGAAAMGVLAGLAGLAQANLLVYATAAALTRPALSPRAPRIIAFALGAALTVLPVTARNALLYGEPVLISGNNGVNFFLGNNAEATGLFHCPDTFTATQEAIFRDAAVAARAATGRFLSVAEVSRYWFNRGFSFIFGEPKAAFKLFCRKILFFLAPDEFVHDSEYLIAQGKVRLWPLLLTNLALLWPLAATGFMLSFHRRRELAPLWLLPPIVAATTVPFFIASRFRLAMVPALTIFAGAGLNGIYDAARRRRKRLLAVSAAVLSIAALATAGAHFLVRSLARPGRTGPDTPIAASMALAAKGEVAAAEQLLANVDLPTAAHRLLFSRGVIRYGAGDMPGAERLFREALEISPTYIDAAYNLGLILNSRRDYSEAGAVLARAASLYPEDAGLHFELGRALRGQGRLKEAEAEFNLAESRVRRSRQGDRRLIEAELATLNKK